MSTAQPTEKTLLRLVVCGSVDDGKSTLVGRLLHDAGMVPSDQLAALKADSAMRGSGEIDFSLLFDGLMAEREQGITIDVAYRYFSTPTRKYIIADAPGHAQFTRNMATAASNADLALVIVDARKGIIEQTRRHAMIAGLLGIRHVVLSVTKMDLVGYAQTTFNMISADFSSLAAALGLPSPVAIPASGVAGDNVVTRSSAMNWYTGPTLLEHLESANAEPNRDALPFRMAVQNVARPHLNFRGVAGRIASGAISPGDRVRIQPSDQDANVARIVTADGDLDRATAGQSVTLVFDPERDCVRGDMIATSSRPCQIADQFQATLIWMSDAPLFAGRKYWIKLGSKTATATITAIRHILDIETLSQRSARQLSQNDIAVCNLSIDQMLAFDPFEQNRETGGFILIDHATSDTAACGLINFALRRSQNIHWQTLEIDRAAHAAIKSQRAAILWFTGLSGAGKSAIANLVEKKLHSMGRHTTLIDGDNLRHGLNRDLGFTEGDRVENIRRAAEVAKLMSDAGLIVLVSFISPFQRERDFARGLASPGEFMEIFVDTPLAVAEARDVKGLYKKARAGQLSNFTGIDSPYEPPLTPEMRIDTTRMSAEDAAEAIVAKLTASEQRA